MYGQHRKRRLACNFNNQSSSCSQKNWDRVISDPFYSSGMNTVGGLISNTETTLGKSACTGGQSDGASDSHRENSLQQVKGGSDLNQTKGWATWKDSNAPSFEAMEDDKQDMLSVGFGKSSGRSESNTTTTQQCSTVTSVSKPTNNTVPGKLPSINIKETQPSRKNGPADSNPTAHSSLFRSCSSPFDVPYSNTYSSESLHLRQDSLDDLGAPLKTEPDKTVQGPDSGSTYSLFGTPDLFKEFRSAVTLSSDSLSNRDLMSGSSTDSFFGSDANLARDLLKNIPPDLQEEVSHVLADSKDVLKRLPSQSDSDSNKSQIQQCPDDSAFESDLVKRMKGLNLLDSLHDSSSSDPTSLMVPFCHTPAKKVHILKGIALDDDSTSLHNDARETSASLPMDNEKCNFSRSGEPNSVVGGGEGVTEMELQGSSSSVSVTASPSQNSESLYPQGSPLTNSMQMSSCRAHEHTDPLATCGETTLMSPNPTQDEAQKNLMSFTSLPSLEDTGRSRSGSRSNSSVSEDGLATACESLNGGDVPFHRYSSEQDAPVLQTLSPGSVTIEDISDDDSAQFLSGRHNSRGQIDSRQGRKPVIPMSEEQEICSLIESLPDGGMVAQLEEKSMVFRQGDDTVVETMRMSQELVLNKSSVRSLKSGRSKELAIAVSNSKDVQAVGNFHYNKQILKVSVNETTKNIKSQIKQELSAAKKLFVKTRAYEKVACVLETEPIVFIIGPSGVGKRMIALELLREYEETQGFEPLILRNVEEMRQMISIDNKQAIVVRNIFGIFEFDQKKFDEFADYFETVVQCADDSKKFIFTSKESVFERGTAWLSMTKIFKKELVVNLLQLDVPNSVEKRKILCYNLKERNVNFPDEVIEGIVNFDTSHVFPKYCQIFAKNTHLHNLKKAFEFFQQPILYERGIIDSMAQREDKKPFAVLVLVMVLGQLCESFLDRVDIPDTERAQKYLAIIGCCDRSSRSGLRSAAESLLGTHLKQCGGSFVFINGWTYDAVACVFGSRYPEQLLEICSVDFLGNKVHVTKDQGTSEDAKICLDETQYDFLSRRFVDELRLGNVYTVCSHIAFTHASFIKAFVDFCQRQIDFKSLLHSKDKHHSLPFLYWSSWNPREHLFKWVLSERKKQKSYPTNKDMTKIVKVCCISGNVKVLEIVFTVLKKTRVMSMVTDYEMTSLALPPCGTPSNQCTERVVSISGLLHTACFHGYLPVVQLLVSQFSCRVDEADGYGQFPVNIAAKQGHGDIVKYLIEKGLILKRVKANKNTVMHDACERGQIEVVNVLLEACPNLLHVQGEEPNLYYPIHLATLSKQCKLVQILLQKGAKPEHVDSDQNTAFHTACMKTGNLRILKVMKPSTSQVNMVNKRNKTCLHLACEFGGAPMVEFLVAKGADVNAVDYMQQTPLHKACVKNKRVIVEKLLANKSVDVFVLDIQGKSALHLALNRPIQKLVKEHMNNTVSSVKTE